MLKQYQQFPLHRPKHGEYADCVRACIACLLDIGCGDVPNFAADAIMEDGMEVWDREAETSVIRRVNAFLMPLKMSLRGFRFRMPEGMTSGEAGLAAALEWSRWLNPDMRYILTGGTGWTGFNHAVIAEGSKIIWNTAPQVRICCGEWPSQRTFTAYVLAARV